MKPLIGITTNHFLHSKKKLMQSSLNDAYVRAVLRAGGMPVLLPALLAEDDGGRAVQESYDRLDGIVLSGGGDIAVERFAGNGHPEVADTNPERDELELRLARLAVDGGKPLLAICRGLQVLNVAQGGTLYTHLPDQLPNALPHQQQVRDLIIHTVELEPGCRTAQILGEACPGTNSMHHQGLERLGEAVRAVGWTSDGLVEAVEIEGHPFALGVQWHPEELQAHEPMRRLFNAFVAACSR